jgi:hypothetical protein
LGAFDLKKLCSYELSGFLGKHEEEYTRRTQRVRLRRRIQEKIKSGGVLSNELQAEYYLLLVEQGSSKPLLKTCNPYQAQHIKKPFPIFINYT